MYTIGLEWKPGGVRAGVIGRDVEPIWRSEAAFAEDADVRTKLEQVAALVREAGERYPLSRAGVSIPGGVDFATGHPLREGTGLDGVAVADELSALTGLPVWADSETEALLAAEWTGGACKGAQNAVLLEIGTDEILGALIMNSQFCRGVNGGAGELGHIPTHADGRKCRCGMIGCLSEYASLRCLEERTGCTAEAAAEYARSGDRRMREQFDLWCNEICTGLVAILCMLDPDTVILAGRGAEAGGRFLLERVHMLLDERKVWCFSRDNIITLPRFHASACRIGAAALAEYYIETERE